MSALDPLLAAMSAVPPEAVGHAAELLGAIAPARERIGALTPREQQVLREMACGARYKLIAWNLGISRRTVEIHVMNLLDRLGVGTHAEAISLQILAWGVR